MQNFMKTILSAVQAWTKGKIKDSTADWNQSDSNADNYVKNRTHYEEETKKKLVDKITLDFSNCESVDWEQTKVGYLYESIELSVVVGQKYEVIFDGVAYECTAFVDKEYDNIVIGNGAFVADSNADTGDIFAIGNYEDGDTYAYIIAADRNSHTISISTTKTVVHKLDPKYLDLPTNMATTDDVQDALDVANEAYQIADNATSMADAAQTTANNAQTTANTKMDKNNPVGTGSFSMNRKEGTTIGAYSYTKGYNNTASGNFSSSTGCETHASQDNEFVCGKFNII